jgi:hypothetical protein
MLQLSDVRIVRKEKGTTGGTTYHVILPNNTKSLPTCLRQIHNVQGMYCARHAGQGTDHVGTGACSKHGGLNNATAVTKIKTGKNAVSTRNRLAADVDLYLQQDRKKLLDLTREFALLRAVLDEYMTQFPEPGQDGYGYAIDRLQSVVGTLGTLVDKMSKVENRNTLTIAQVMYLRATIVDIFMKYIEDPSMRERAVKELAMRMGGDIEVTMDASEYSLLPGGDV